MRTLVAITVAAGALVAVPTISSAYADSGCRTIHDHFTKTDSGHGTPAEWADLSFSRTTTICDAEDGYSVRLEDQGRLWTRAGAGSPNGTGAPIENRVGGTMAGFDTVTIDGGSFAPPTHRDTSLSSMDYVKSLFDGGTATGRAYTWTYRTCLEKWVDSSRNNDGQGATSGNITGKRCQPHQTPTPTPTDSPTPTPSPTESTPGEAPAPTPVRSDLPVTG
jgi:hypothetical protein